MAKLARFEILPIGNESARMAIKDSDGAEWSVELDYSKLVDLARRLPLFVNQLAQRHTNPSDPDVRVTADAVPAAGTEVNTDLLGEAIFLAIDDAHGVRAVWRLTPEHAESLGRDLVKSAKRLKPQKAKH